eukprot:47348-Eustigmatos_ZCMA.PRE.1
MPGVSVGDKKRYRLHQLRPSPDPTLALLKHVLADDDPVLWDYILDTFAYHIQRPFVKIPKMFTFYSPVQGM